MKQISITLTALVLTAGVFLAQCTHDDEVTTPDGFNPIPVERGDDQVSVSNDWNFDKTHSSVRWETAYLGTAALLTGRFNDFDITLEFDESNPENIEISGRVTLSSVNTGEPGRDQGCLLGTFGVEESDEAVFNTINVEFDESDPTGYIVTGDLVFHGVTSEIVMKLNYLGSNIINLRGDDTNVAGFKGQFEINAKSVFGIESSSIADRVVISINGQFTQPI